jgi:hypothetical protein
MVLLPVAFPAKTVLAIGTAADPAIEEAGEKAEVRVTFDVRVLMVK